MALCPSHLHTGDLVRIRGERWRVSRRAPYGDVTLIEVSGADEANRGTRAGFLLPFEPLERVIVPAAPRVVRPSRWRRIVRSALAHATPTAHALRAAVGARLAIVPFQLEPALAVTSGRGCRLLIADEVGLGKTIQAGLIVAEVFAREADARALVVCPAGLRSQWQAELAERFGLNAVVLDAAALARVGSEQGAGANPWLSLRLAVTSIDYLKRPEVLRAVEPVVWDVVIFDEAHALAGPSDRATAASALGTRARRVVMLTATPHSGDEEAFHRLCGIGHLAGDPPLIVFRRSRHDAGITRVRRTTTLRVRPSREEIEVHAALLAYAGRVWDGSSAAHPGARLAMTVLMRRACSSVTSLARSLERRRSLLTTTLVETAQLTLPFLEPDEDDEPAALLGVPGLDDVSEEQRTLERLLVLAQRAAAAGERKIAALGRLLRRVHEPVLVFTEYRDTLAHVAGRLPVAAVTLHGGLTPRQRQGVAREFTEGSAGVLLATDAASEGLNLHRRCRLVINLELPWTPLRLEQRVGRVDRIGQSHAVHAMQLVARGTGEESVVARLLARQARARVSLEQIGEAVVRGTPLPAARAGSDASDTARNDVVTVDLHIQASAEAERLRSAHRLLERAASPSSRPAICVLRRRTLAEPRRIWTWRMTCVDECGRVIWESLLPLCAAAERGPDTAAWARRSLDWRVAGLAACVEQAEGAKLRALADEMRAPVALLTSRERAIAKVLEEKHARLAAALLQPGLFDRRAERAAAARASLLNEARSRTVARLIELEASGRPGVEERTLVFAVALQ